MLGARYECFLCQRDSYGLGTRGGGRSVAKVAEIAKANENKWSLEEAAKPYSGVTFSEFWLMLQRKQMSHRSTMKSLQSSRASRLYGSSFLWDELRSKAFLDFTSRTGAYDLVWLSLMIWQARYKNGYIQPITNFLTNPALLDPEIHLEDYSGDVMEIYELVW